jgi:hypothetical protein
MLITYSCLKIISASLNAVGPVLVVEAGAYALLLSSANTLLDAVGIEQGPRIPRKEEPNYM